MSIRSFISNKLYKSIINNIVIKRTTEGIIVLVYILKVSKNVKQIVSKSIYSDLSSFINSTIHSKLMKFDLIEVNGFYSSSSSISYYMKQQLENRIPFRKVLNSVINKVKELNKSIKGIKVQISGRLNGAEIARTEWIRKGQVPLHTLSANIDYSVATAIVFNLFFIINFLICLKF